MINQAKLADTLDHPAESVTLDQAPRQLDDDQCQARLG